MTIVICADSKYAAPLFALLHSIAVQECSKSAQVYIIACGFDEAVARRLRKHAGDWFMSFEFIAANSSFVSHLPVQRWMTHTAYIKLLIPRFLPSQVTRAIVLDADVIVTRSLRDLWNTPLQGNLALAAQDYGCPYVSSSFGIKRYAEAGMSADAPYFNSGVMVIDVEGWRRDDVPSLCIEYLELNRCHLRCHDQEALNAVLGRRWGSLDPRWNQMPHIYWVDAWSPSPFSDSMRARRAELVTNPFIIHFAARSKPWLPGCGHPARGLFFKHLRSSGWLPIHRYLRWRWQLRHESRKLVAHLERPSVLNTSISEAVVSNSSTSVCFPIEASARLIRYRKFDAVSVPLGNHSYLVRSAYSNVSRIVPAGIAHVLFNCKSFRTIGEHARRACELEVLRTADGRKASASLQPTDALSGRLGDSVVPVKPGDVEKYERLLDDFARDGFLLSEREISSAVRCAVSEKSVRSIKADLETIGITTRDRPDCLRRALRSYINNLQQFGRKASMLVVDDSRSNAIQVANAAVCHEVSKASGMQIAHYDLSRRCELIRELAAASGVPTSVIEFAVLGEARFPLTHGAARNTLQLLAAGTPILQVDDDTVCEISEPVSNEPRCPTACCVEYWSLQDPNWTREVKRVDVDLLSAHEALLSQSVHGEAGSSSDPQFIAEDGTVTPQLLSSLQHPEAGVAVTVGGSVGDSGMATHWFRLFLQGASFERLVRDPEMYIHKLTSPEVVRVAPSATVSDSHQVVAMNIALDNRRQLPPFMPVQRREEGIFIAVLRRCAPYALCGYLPYAILHLPPTRRRPEAPPFEEIGRTTRVNDLLLCMLMSGLGPSLGGDCRRNLTATGYALAAIAASPPREFCEFLRSLSARAVAAEISLLERRLEERSNSPSFWARDARRYISALKYAVTLPQFLVPADLDGDSESRLLMFQDVVGRYGELLVHWPALWESAKANSKLVSRRAGT